MTSTQKDDLLLEALHPHLASEEGENFLRGQATMEKIQVRTVALSPRFCRSHSSLSLNRLSLRPLMSCPFSSDSTGPYSPANLLSPHTQSLLSQNNGAETVQRFTQLLLQFM